MKHHISVAGNIGAGKSTLVRLLCPLLGCVPFYEPVVENPYLPDFYADMPAWGFHSQVFFLANRLKIHRAVLDCPQSSIQDRSIYEDAEIFAANLHARGGMNARDYATYRALYEGIAGFLPPPDLLIYLQVEPAILAERIRQRGRDYENSIPSGYLAELNQRYEAWINSFSLCPVLMVPAGRLNFALHTDHLHLVAEMVREKLSGKTTVSFADLPG